MTSNNKKNLDNARRFLWEDDDSMSSAAARSRNSTTGTQSRGFSTRDYAVDQSVNLMALDERTGSLCPVSTNVGSSGTSLSSSIAGLFRATTGTEGQEPNSVVAGKGVASFDEYGDAAPSADAEEYISDKRRRISPLWTPLVNCWTAVVGRCTITCGRLGLRGTRLVLCLVVAMGLVGVSLFMVLSGKDSSSGNISGDPRFNNLMHRIVQTGTTPQSVLDSISSPQRKALEWLAHEDSAKLPADHPALLDRYSLAVFFYSSSNAQKTSLAGGWTISDGWLTEKGICSWHGIECFPKEQEPSEENNFELFTKTYDDNARVMGILLTGNNIEGIIPEEWGLSMEQLATLDLQNNAMSHTIPTSIGNLSQLRNLLLRENTFIGRLPSELGALTDLHQVNLAKNGFEGAIPASWSDLKEIRHFAVSNNLLTGKFPEFSKMTKLMGLFLEDNDFQGDIPTFLRTLTDLLDLRLSQNQFQGNIDLLSSLQNIETIYLDNNKFEGTIPDIFDHIYRLQELLIQNNNLKGPLPPTLSHLRSLKTLNLAHNSLDGNVPAGLGLLTDVVSIILSDNKFSGYIPTLLGKLDDIQILALNENSLTGSIPSELGLCFRLKELYLDSNKLNGEIPSHLEQLDSLEKLHIEKNEFEGISMPSQVCALRKDALSVLAADCKQEGQVDCNCCTQCK